MSEDRAMVPIEQRGVISTDAGAGTFALAVLTDFEFEQRITTLRRGLDRVARIQRELMTPDIDFGIIPGTPKPTLYKAGAEKLCNFYRLAPTFESVRLVGDGVTSPTITWLTTCRLHLSDTSGPIIGEGEGSANSWERKHRYRSAERACPECGVLKSIVKGRDEYERDARFKGGWLCFTKKGGCGAKFVRDDPRIIAQQLGEVENPDPWDLDNTLLRMSIKRGYVDGALRTTATSGLFTQDLEDMEQPSPPPQPAPPPPTPPAPTPTKPKPGTPEGRDTAFLRVPQPTGKRTMTEDGRARMAAAEEAARVAGAFEAAAAQVGVEIVDATPPGEPDASELDEPAAAAGPLSEMPERIRTPLLAAAVGIVNTPTPDWSEQYVTKQVGTLGRSLAVKGFMPPDVDALLGLIHLVITGEIVQAGKELETADGRHCVWLSNNRSEWSILLEAAQWHRLNGEG